MNSTEWLKLVLRDGDLPHFAKKVAIVLAMESDDDLSLRVDLPVGQLAHSFGTSKDSVKSALASLVSSAWLRGTPNSPALFLHWGIDA